MWDLTQVLADPAHRDTHVLRGLGRVHPRRAVRVIEPLGQRFGQGIQVPPRGALGPAFLLHEEASLNAGVRGHGDVAARQARTGGARPACREAGAGRRRRGSIEGLTRVARLVPMDMLVGTASEYAGDVVSSVQPTQSAKRPQRSCKATPAMTAGSTETSQPILPSCRRRSMRS